MDGLYWKILLKWMIWGTPISGNPQVYNFLFLLFAKLLNHGGSLFKEFVLCLFGQENIGTEIE